MAQLVKIEAKVPMKNPDKLMDFLKNNLHTLPQLFPEAYKSVEVRGGGGRKLTTGSIIMLTYSLPGSSASSSSNLMRGEVKVEAMDEAKKSMTLSVVGGDGLKTYKSFRSKCEIVGKTVNWSIEYEKATPSSPPAAPYLEFYVKLSKFFDI